MTTLLEKACIFLFTKASPSYNKETCGHCAAAVRSAVDFAFNCHIERREAAKDYAPSYEKIGFKKVFTYSGVNKKDYHPKAGDISIIQYEPDGHICMFNGKIWISDFIQSDGGSKLPLAAMYGGKIRDKDPKFDIYRYEPAN